jgi:isoleucyl-tRNA synthetase
MTLARRITSLGLSARSAANLKVRQPLSRILVHVQEGRHDLSAPMVEIVCDELNIKVLEFVDDPGKLVTYKILPNNRLLGPKLGKDFPTVRAALAALDPNAVARQVISGESLLLNLGGSGEVALLPEEVLLQTEPAPGLAVTADKVLTVGIDATVTAELRVEGLAREVVRRIQSMRKNAGFDIADHIISWYHTGSDELAEVMAVWMNYVQAETLSNQVIAGMPPADAYVEEHKLDGMDATFGVLRAR